MTSMTEIWLSDLGLRAGGPWGRAYPERPWKVKADGTNDKEQHYHDIFSVATSGLFIWPCLGAFGFPHQGLNCTQPSFSDNESSL